MKTFYEIIKDVSNMRWSIVDPEPKSFGEVEQFIKQAIQQAHSYIWNLSDFPFKERTETVLLQKNNASISAPWGMIKNIMIKGDNYYLEEEENFDFLTQIKGKPQTYWVTYGEDKNILNFNPVPEQTYEIQLRYDMLCKARDKDGNLKPNLENMDDIINISQEYEEVYLNCLKNKAMCYLIADNSDENYVPYQKQFIEQYGVLKQLKGHKREPYIII